MTAGSTDHSTGSGSGVDALDLLATDHREFFELIEQLQAGGDGEQRRELADALIGGLVRHSVAEEMHVYPLMRDHLPDGEAAVDHDTSEHKELEALLKQLEGADAGSPEFGDVVQQIQAALRDHVRDEEEQQFPALRQHAPAEQLLELRGQVETAKRVAPTRPHPMSPNAELFHKTVGPGVGLVDRLRDRLTGRNA